MHYPLIGSAELRTAEASRPAEAGQDRRPAEDDLGRWRPAEDGQGRSRLVYTCRYTTDNFATIIHEMLFKMLLIILLKVLAKVLSKVPLKFL